MNRKNFLLEHNTREKEVLNFLMEITQECNTIFFKNEKGITPIPQRIQTIITFSLIDVLASYWFCYLGKTGTPSERFKAWYETFCTTTNNQFYKGFLKEVSPERFYSFRSALVHFFGMGESSGDIFFALVANDFPDDKKEKMEADFAKKNHKTFILRPKDFFDLVREGAILMLESWGEVIQAAQTDQTQEKAHTDGIERVWAKVLKEGAKGMSRQQAGIPI